MIELTSYEIMILRLVLSRMQDFRTTRKMLEAVTSIEEKLNKLEKEQANDRETDQGGL